MADLATRPPLDPDVVNRIKPVLLSRDRMLEVPGPLEPLFPWGGMQRGWSVGFDGHGSWSLAMTILAAGLGSEGWAAVVGLPDLNLAAAADHGVRLDRLIVLEDPGPGRWATTAASLLEAIDVVVVAPSSRVGHRDARRLTARAREQQAVLFHLDGGETWPSQLDLVLTTDVERWNGIGQGHGHLRTRTMRVDAVGRRTGSQPRSVVVQLPGTNGVMVSVDESPGDRRPSAERSIVTLAAAG